MQRLVVSKTDKGKRDAGNAAPLSAMLRRLVHRRAMPVSTIAARLGVRTSVLDEFLSGHKILQSTVIDQLSDLLNVRLQTPKRWPFERIRIRRVYGTLSPAQVRHLKKVRILIDKELPKLIRRNQLAHDASKEKTVSGALRRAIRSCRIMLRDLARRAAVDERIICGFLTGEKPLPSDAMDRLVGVLKLKPHAQEPKQRTAKAS